VAEGTVKSWLHRARTTLAENLRNSEHEEVRHA
jgi:DNA-directed RNA polymerase specialized sigma24 family protein